DEMWSDDKYWLPIFLDGKRFKGKFFFDKSNEVVDYSLWELQLRYLKTGTWRRSMRVKEQLEKLSKEYVCKIFQ
ncbi:hypothetical protein GQ568_03415, partial [Patescibacteria group bacterium]|nr:hypothetical protein [Patescibacteria group bacterium]